MAKVTIEDISRQTGLSRGTVSRALNNRPDISQHTRQRVLDACTKLNYIPSIAARSLATGRNYVLAVLVSDLASPGAAQYLRGAMSVADASHYAVHLVTLPLDVQAADARLRALASERMDGLLLGTIAPSTATAGLREALTDRKAASIAALDGIACDVFTPDYAEAGRLIAARAAALGRRRGLLVAGAGCGQAAEIQAALRDGAAGAAVSRVDTDALGRAAGLESARQADLVLAIGDDATLAVAGALLAAGRVPGRDLELIAAGEARLGRLSGASVLDLGWYEIGRRSAAAILDRVQGERMDAPQNVRVAPQLTPAESRPGA